MRNTLVCSLLLGAVSCALAQETGIQRIAGHDEGSGIDYVLLTTTGKRVSGAAPDAAPRLTAQCTRTAAGKAKLEVMADFGGAVPLVFVPPWHPTPGDLYPPNLPKVTLTMEFLGYTKVKPVKRAWEALLKPEGDLQYGTPGARSSNLEPITFWFQYLRSLPTLRLTDAAGHRAAEWETPFWLRALHAEPLCAAAGA